MSDALRVYLRELRIKRGFTQEKAADAIGWSARSFNDWETGKNDDIKSRFLIRLVLLLNASWDDVSFLELNDVSMEEALRLSNKRGSADNTQSSNTDVQKLIEQLWLDDELRNAFLVFWSGWKARELTN